MNASQALRTERAIAECDRYIALEGARAADLRPANVQATLDSYIAHRAKLAQQLTAHFEAEGYTTAGAIAFLRAQGFQITAPADRPLVDFYMEQARDVADRQAVRCASEACQRRSR